MRASRIKPKAVQWLRYPYLPLGKLTAIAGQMGQAKSLYTIYEAAQVTIGNTDLGEPRSVVMLNAEDDHDDTLVPRLMAAGADLERVWIDPVVDIDADRLREVCDEIGDVALISIDPIQAYLPSGVDSWKGQHVRAALEPLRQFASLRQISIPLVQHLNRRSDAKEPLARIADSQGIPQLCRSVLLWGPNPADPDGDQGSMKVLTRAKNNLARSQTSATFTIDQRVIEDAEVTKPQAFLKRGADSELTADEVVADAEARSAAEDAVAWLRHALEDGPLPAKEVLKRASADGITERTLNRAKHRAGVVSRPRREDGEKGGKVFTGWEWQLRDGLLEPSSKSSTDKTLGNVGNVGNVSQVAQVAQVANHSEPPSPLPDLSLLEGCADPEPPGNTSAFTNGERA